ncbi:MAG: hypothetical protein AAB525_04055 [Patescibacteria group bacterium]
MKTQKIDSDELKKFFKQTKIANLDELKKFLGTDVAVTIFRKLREQKYQSSYSHRGKYYTIDGIGNFNTEGLWCHQSVWFSNAGNLLQTIVSFVNRSTAGYHAEELENALHVVVKQALLTLLERKQISREKVAGLYLYCSCEREVKNKQIDIRQGLNSNDDLRSLGSEMISDELKAAIVLFYCGLSEKHRRQYAGLESLRLGYGGDSKIADLLGIDVHTVARGRNELLEKDISLSGVRMPGGGRHSLEKKARKSLRKSKN